MLSIYLTRHGETEWNKEHRLQGWKNSPLTDKGINNAVLLGKRLADTKFNVIYSSPSERAVTTAKYICSEREIPILTDDNLREIFLGEWEGKTKEEIEPRFKSEFDNFWGAPQLYNHQPHGGEGLKQFKHRVEDSIKRIIAENPGGNILIVHAVVIKAMLSFMMGIPTENMWDPPFIHGTSLTVFNWDGENFYVEKLGDTSHFA